MGSKPNNSLKIIAAIPAFNAERYIGSIVLKTRQYVDEIIVVDDGSTDQTAVIARLAGANVVQHGENRGKGGAIQTILSEVRRKDPDILVLLDADAQHNPDEIPYLTRPVADGYDLVIGSRKEQAYKTPPYRRLGQKVLLYMNRILSKHSPSDTESGFRALSKKAVFNIELKESGFAVETEMIARAVEKNLKVTEVPISNIYIKDGSTQNPMRHGLGVLVRILAMISESRPLLFFGIFGLILVSLGFITSLRVLGIASEGGGVAIGTALVSILLLIIGVLSLFTGIILNALSRWKG